MLMDDFLLHLLESKLEKQQQRKFEKKIILLKGGKPQQLNLFQMLHTHTHTHTHTQMRKWLCLTHYRE